MEKHATVDIFVELLVAGGKKGQLFRIGLLIKILFHAKCGDHPLHRMNAHVEEPPIEDFSQPQCRQIILNKNDLLFLQSSFLCRRQPPQEHVGIFFKIFFREHYFFLYYIAFKALRSGKTISLKRKRCQ